MITCECPSLPHTCGVARPIEKRCPMCGAVMNPQHAWLWTAYGATDTENCARLLVEREHEAEARLL